MGLFLQRRRHSHVLTLNLNSKIQFKHVNIIYILVPETVSDSVIIIHELNFEFRNFSF